MPLIDQRWPLLHKAPSRSTGSMLAGAVLAAASLGAHADEAEQSPEGEFTVTFGAMYGTDSLSGSSTKAKLSPLLDLSYSRGRLSAGLGGVQYQVIKGDELDVGVGLGYDRGRKEKDSPRLRGMGNVPATAQILLNANWQLLDGLITLSAETSSATRRSNGSTGSLGATVAYPLAGDELIGVFTVSTGFANKQYMQTQYGVSAAQATRSGYSVFTPKAGHYESSAALGLEYTINKQWSSSLLIGAIRREGDAAKSPIYTRRTEPNASLSASYRF
jgi:MipA family protein